MKVLLQSPKETLQSAARPFSHMSTLFKCCLRIFTIISIAPAFPAISLLCASGRRQTRGQLKRKKSTQFFFLFTVCGDVPNYKTALLAYRRIFYVLVHSSYSNFYGSCFLCNDLIVNCKIGSHQKKKKVLGWCLD